MTRTTTESTELAARDPSTPATGGDAAAAPSPPAGEAPESAAGPGGPRRRGLRPRVSGTTVRTRIVAAVALLTTFALTASGLLVYSLEMRRMQSLVHADVRQEIAELYELQFPQVEQPDGSQQREPAFDSVPELLTSFLSGNVPGDDELFVAWWDDEPKLSTGHPLVDATVQEPGFESGVRAMLPDGGSRTRQVEGIGEYLLTVQPLGRTSASQPDALVIVSFLEPERRELARTMRTYAIVAVALLLLIVLIAWMQAGRLLGPLRALRTNAERINTADLNERIPVAGNDDIGQLTRTYNAMLDRLQQGFGAQRQFLDDAGHELRTPLTILRGHLELLDAHNPADVEETGELLLDEVDRMSRLVDELILLAKSDRPDFVRRSPTAVTDLLEQVHRKAGALDPQRDWRLGELPPRHLSALLDEQRITQALLQLCDNAVKHTSPGDRITLSGSEVGGLLRLSVTDTGAGVAPEDRVRIFERFGRAHVPDGDEGFGLGLSIVRAIAEAHDAEVGVEDGPGGGARFYLQLDTTTQGAASWPES